MLGFLVLSLLLQLGLVAAIYHNKKRRMLIELLGTVTFIKPAFNKWRVLTNAKIEGHEIMSPVSEMMYFKMAEVFAESIPVTVLQVNSILTSDEFDIIVVMAMITSIVFGSCFQYNSVLAPWTRLTSIKCNVLFFLLDCICKKTQRAFLAFTSVLTVGKVPGRAHMAYICFVSINGLCCNFIKSRIATVART